MSAAAETRPLRIGFTLGWENPEKNEAVDTDYADAGPGLPPAQSALLAWCHGVDRPLKAANGCQHRKSNAGADDPVHACLVESDLTAGPTED